MPIGSFGFSMAASSMADALVEAIDAGRVFGSGDHRVVALEHATCRVAAGDRIALVGPSGSGKSTLLHLLAGLDAPTSGVVCWPALGELQTLRPSKLSFVFQNESLLAPLSILENVEVPQLLAGAGAVAARQEAIDVLEALDLEAIADKLPEEVSGGQAQRAAVARSLVTKPALILADEPTGQLDHVTAARLLDLLDQRLRGTPTALVIATHDASVAQRMSVRWTIHHGVLA